MTRIATAALAVFFPVLATAHDFWIEPSTFRPAVGDRVTAALRVGEKLRGDPVPRIPPYIERFILKGSGAETPILGTPGIDPAGNVQIADKGMHWIGYQSTPSPMVVDAPKFEQYLREEGLERIIEQRARSGQSSAPGRERFSRCAKSLLFTAADDAYSESLGFTLELVPRRNPYAIRAGDDLPLTLLFREKPLANALVVAMSKTDPERAVRARTDSHGRVSLPIAHSGFWLVKAVHMEPAPPDAGVDWESWWASVTFELE